MWKLSLFISDFYQATGAIVTEKNFNFQQPKPKPTNQKPLGLAAAQEVLFNS